MSEPWPPTVSAQARQAVAAVNAASPPPGEPDLAQMRAFSDLIQQTLGQAQLERYGVTVRDGEVGGIPARIFTPPEGRTDPDAPILLNFHGGGFIVDSGSMTENIALAARTGLTIVSALYRLAPEHRFPAAVDDAEQAYRAMLARHPAEKIGVFGTSAGAILSAQLMERLGSSGLPRPAALGFYSGVADLARDGDSESYLPRVNGARSVVEGLSIYAGAAPKASPALSPIFGDLGGYPPTQVMASTQDQLLSQSALFHRALVNAGAEAELIVFEALPHAFWAYIEAPETEEAFDHMARFFRKRLK